MEDSNLRLFATLEGCITLGELRCSTESAILQLEAGTEELWDRSLLRHKNGAEIARIERYEITPFQLGAKTIRECVEEARGKAPVRAANWLADFSRRVQTFYVFRSFGGARIDAAWREPDAVADYLWHEQGGIFQTSEGFTNEWGYHILLQCPDTARGPRWTGLLQPDGTWIHFKMDLGDRIQREQFSHGELPEGVELAPRLNDPFGLYNPFESA
jgi:hypothetical protein